MIETERCSCWMKAETSELCTDVWRLSSHKLMLVINYKGSYCIVSLMLGLWPVFGAFTLKELVFVLPEQTHQSFVPVFLEVKWTSISHPHTAFGSGLMTIDIKPIHKTEGSSTSIRAFILFFPFLSPLHLTKTNSVCRQRDNSAFYCSPAPRARGEGGEGRGVRGRLRWSWGDL